MNLTLETAMLVALTIGAFAALTLTMRKRERLLMAKIALLAVRVDKAEQESERQRGVMGKLVLVNQA